MKILLYGEFFGGNLGDDLLLEVVGQYLIDNNIKYDVFYHGKENYFSEHQPVKLINLTFGNYFHIGFIQKILKRLKMNKINGKILKKYSHIIFLGGGYFTSVFLMEKIIMLLK